MNFQSRKFLSLALFSAILMVSFQNCSKDFHIDPTNSQLPITNKTSLIDSSLSGNGEGYGGKLTGVYASVDSLNYCGQASVMQVPIREQIEILGDGTAQKTIENCQRLAVPKKVQLKTIQQTSQDNSLFVLGGLIYEKAPWVQMGFAPRNRYVSMFCYGLSPTNNSLQKRMDLFLYKDDLSLSYDMPWLPDFTFSQPIYETGQFYFYDINPQTQQIVSSQFETVSLQDLLTQSNNMITHDLQMIGTLPTMPTISSFDMTYTTRPDFTQIKQPDFNITSTSSADIDLKKCFSNQ